MAWRPARTVTSADLVRRARPVGWPSCRPAGRARGVRRGGRARLRAVGVRGAADRRAASRGSASTPTTAHPQRGRLDRHSAVHLDKGCYRGQETVARVHTLGRPPRRLTLLHLDGSENRLPAAGPTGHARREGGRLRRQLAPATTSSARSRWPWSSATSRWTADARGRRRGRRRRRSWSTPRSACTCGRSAESARPPARPGVRIGSPPSSGCEPVEPGAPSRDASSGEGGRRRPRLHRPADRGGAGHPGRGGHRRRRQRRHREGGQPRRGRRSSSPTSRSAVSGAVAMGRLTRARTEMPRGRRLHHRGADAVHATTTPPTCSYVRAAAEQIAPRAARRRAGHPGVDLAAGHHPAGQRVAGRAAPRPAAARTPPTASRTCTSRTARSGCCPAGS